MKSRCGRAALSPPPASPSSWACGRVPPVSARLVTALLAECVSVSEHTPAQGDSWHMPSICLFSWVLLLVTQLLRRKGEGGNASWRSGARDRNRRKGQERRGKERPISWKEGSRSSEKLDRTGKLSVFLEPVVL